MCYFTILLHPTILYGAMPNSSVCYGARDTKILVLDLCSRGVTSAIRSGSSQDTEPRALRGSCGLP